MINYLKHFWLKGQIAFLGLCCRIVQWKGRRQLAAAAKIGRRVVEELAEVRETLKEFEPYTDARAYTFVEMPEEAKYAEGLILKTSAGVAAGMSGRWEGKRIWSAVVGDDGLRQFGLSDEVIAEYRRDLEPPQALTESKRIALFARRVMECPLSDNPHELARFARLLLAKADENALKITEDLKLIRQEAELCREKYNW